MLLTLARISYMARVGGIYFALNYLEQSLIRIHQELRTFPSSFSVLLHENLRPGQNTGNDSHEKSPQMRTVDCFSVYKRHVGLYNPFFFKVPYKLVHGLGCTDLS